MTVLVAKRLGVLGIVIGVLAACAFVAQRHRDPSARCPQGLEPQGPRCCGTGQTLSNGRCTANATSCAVTMRSIQFGGQSHCVAQAQRVRIAARRLALGPTDWEAQGVVSAREVSVAAFDLDSIEYTWGRYAACRAQGICSELLTASEGVEPGLPITRISAEHARSLCASEGGRLPNGDEWLAAAAGAEARRFPWGNTGLVCRRAAFGLKAGPCAENGVGPDLAGARPDGATPEGIQDLVGNVAEWTLEPQGVLARGGSFQSNVAGQLKSWTSAAVAEPSAEVGFRCAYDIK